MSTDPHSAEELLPARPARSPWWSLLAVAVCVLAGLQLARHGRVEAVHGSGHGAAPRSSAVPPSGAGQSSSPVAGPAPLSAVVGNRCPTSVVCGVRASVAAGMAAAFRRDFPTAVISLQASAFDAGALRTYWQQVSATTPAGTVIVLTEQRLLPGPRQLGPGTTKSPDGTTVTIRGIRGGWAEIASLLGTDATALPINAARRWVAATPLPS